MDLRELMNENIINLNLKAKSKRKAINKIAKMLSKDNRINSLREFIADVYKREAMESTNMGIGVAIPHSKTIGIKKSSVALVRLNKEISWEDGGEPVKTIFLLAVSPEDKGVEHLEVISKIATLLIDDDFISLLNGTDDSKELLDRMDELVGGEKWR